MNECDGLVSPVVTPYQYLYGDFRPHTVVLFSASGSHPDTLDVFDVALDRQSRVIVVTYAQESELLRRVRGAPSLAGAVLPVRTSEPDGFLAERSVLAMGAVLWGLVSAATWSAREMQEAVTSAVQEHRRFDVDGLEFPFVQIVASSWALAAAKDLEARTAESGVGCCTVTDPGNFGHGRFMSVVRSPRSIMLLLASSDEIEPMERLREQLPDGVDVRAVYAPFGRAPGAVYCVTRSIMIARDIAACVGVDASAPDVPIWGRRLFEESFLRPAKR